MHNCTVIKAIKTLQQKYYNVVEKHNTVQTYHSLWSIYLMSVRIVVVRDKKSIVSGLKIPVCSKTSIEELYI